MKNSVVIKINNKEIETSPDQTVLTVARTYGIDIPALCYLEGLEPYGACRLCLVEVVKGTKTGITTSCTLKVHKDLEVLTDTEAVKKYRKILLELYLAQAPNAELIKEIALKYGVTETRFSKKIAPQDPLQNKCILCGLCIRVCEAMGVSAISYIGRGIYTKINTPYLEPSKDCTGCGACAKICPTGAIKIEDIEQKRIMHSWSKTELDLKKCTLCGKIFSTESFVDLIFKNTREIDEELKNLCSDCRRKLFSKKATVLLYLQSSQTDSQNNKQWQKS